MLNCGHQQLLVPNVFKFVSSYEMRAALVLLKFPIRFVHESVAHGTPHTGDISAHPFSPWRD